jgi:hypothetical protein
MTVEIKSFVKILGGSSDFLIYAMIRRKNPKERDSLSMEIN